MLFYVTADDGNLRMPNGKISKLSKWLHARTSLTQSFSYSIEMFSFSHFVTLVTEAILTGLFHMIVKGLHTRKLRTQMLSTSIQGLWRYCYFPVSCYFLTAVVSHFGVPNLKKMQFLLARKILVQSCCYSILTFCFFSSMIAPVCI